MVQPTTASSAAPVSADALKDVTWERLPEIIPAARTDETWTNPMDASRVALGCFDAKGNWTEDREKCHENQRAFIERLTIETRTDDDATSPARSSAAPAAPAPAWTPTVSSSASPEFREVQGDTTVRLVIDEDFVSERERQEKIAALRSTVEETLAALDALEKRSILPEAAKTVVRERKIKLNETLINAGAGTIADVQRRAESTKRDIATIGEAVSEAVNTEIDTANVPTDSEMSAIVARLDRIVSAVPNAHALLAAEKITVNAVASLAYDDASKHLRLAHDNCRTLTRCDALLDTVTSLEKWREGMRAAVTAAGRPDLLANIEGIVMGR